MNDSLIKESAFILMPGVHDWLTRPDTVKGVLSVVSIVNFDWNLMMLVIYGIVLSVHVLCN